VRIYVTIAKAFKVSPYKVCSILSVKGPYTGISQDIMLRQPTL